MKRIRRLFGIDDRAELRSRAKRGDPEAAFQLALAIRQDSPGNARVAELLECAANAGVLAAAFDLGISTFDFHWLRHAAKHGHLDAAAALGIYRNHFRNIDDRDMQELWTLVTSAASVGHQDSRAALVDLLLEEFGCDFDEEMYYQTLFGIREPGVTTMVRLAWCHVFGIGTEQSLEAAERLFDQVRDRCRFSLAGDDTDEPEVWMYRNSVTMDVANVANTSKYIMHHLGGTRRFLRAFDRGDPAACYIVALALLDKQLPNLVMDADALILSAAESAFPPALMKVALTRNDGRDADFKVRTAAEAGFVPAQLELVRRTRNQIEQCVWKTLVFAQESYFGFGLTLRAQRGGGPLDNEPYQYGRPLHADIDDDVLRAVGFSERASSLVHVEAPALTEQFLRVFYERLAICYEQHVRPFRPLTPEAMRSAIFNIIGYDEGQQTGPTLAGHRIFG